MRFAMLAAVLLILSLSSHAQDASAALTAACDQATSSLERHDLGCPDDEDGVQTLPESDSSD